MSEREEHKAGERIRAQQRERERKTATYMYITETEREKPRTPGIDIFSSGLERPWLEPLVTSSEPLGLVFQLDRHH